MTNYHNDNLFSISGKNILVTGSSGQLGDLICKELAKRGAIVFGLDKNPNVSKNQNQNINLFEIDINDNQEISEIFSKVRSMYGEIDVLINNAGVNTFTSFEDRTQEQFESVINVNLKASSFMIKEFCSTIKNDNKMRHIINIASVYGIISPNDSLYDGLDWMQSEVYAASKGGLIQLTKFYASHLAKKNIRVNAISPGGIYNKENPQNSKFINRYAKLTPLKRMASDNEVIGAVIFLSSDSSSYVTGHNLVVDGGFSIW